MKTEYKGYQVHYSLKDKIWQVWKGKEAICTCRTKHIALIEIDRLC